MKDFTMRVCASDVTVRVSDNSKWAVEGMGRCNAFTGNIELSQELPPATFDQTFLHELIHLILDWSGFPNISKEEAVVNALSLHLLAWMRDNPKLVQAMSKNPAELKKIFLASSRS